MRKFLFGSVLTLVVFFIFHYCIYYQGLYHDFHPSQEVTTIAATKDKKIYVQRNNQLEPFIIEGVDIDSSIPGHFSTDFAINEKDYYRWFGMIQEMGANTIRVYTIMNDDFYNALYQFNTSSKEPLYLLQGLWVTDYANNSYADAYSKQFYGELKKDAIAAVDVIHGRKNIALNRVKGSGSYRKDVSPWVLGYILGLEWNAKTIAYTDHLREGEEGFDGEYVRTSPEATPFETMLAQILDQMISYESKKYKEQRLVSLISDPSIDPFIYEEEYGRQISKFVNLNPEHIVMKDTVISGLFASYHLYEFCPGFVNCFSEQQKIELAPILNHLNSSYYYEGYTQLLSEYHTIPVVITGYGYSSARATDHLTSKNGQSIGVLTEEQQGIALVNTYRDIIASGCAGAVISSWQDVWGQRTWNTTYAVDSTNAPKWSDPQTADQGYGILTFDPGKKKSVCYVDGDASEWTKEDLVINENGVRLSAKYDEKFMYFLIQKPNLSEHDSFYIPIDTTPKTGSNYCENFGLNFERNVDFLLCIDGRDNSRLMVQSRYEALRENYLQQTQGKDPFIKYPEKDSPLFVNINMILKITGVVENAYDENGLRKRRLADTYETGKLTCGNGNPESAEYLSTADFCYGKDNIEIKIPWQMLNFSDPSVMAIHDDYYQHYGVKNIHIRKCYLGIQSGTGQDVISLKELKLKGWRIQEPSFHERLKKSYQIIKSEWTKRNDTIKN